MIDEADNRASFRRRFARSLLPELAQAHPVTQFKPMLIQLRYYFHDLTLLKFMDDTAAYKVVRESYLRVSAKCGLVAHIRPCLSTSDCMTYCP
jgi:hypothetical protein